MNNSQNTNDNITTLDSDTIYHTNSGMGGVFTLKYLGYYDNYHHFKSTSWFNTGAEYKVKENDLKTFLK